MRRMNLGGREPTLPLALKIEVFCISLADLTTKQTERVCRNDILVIYSCRCNNSSSVRQLSLNCLNGSCHSWPATQSGQPSGWAAGTCSQ